MVVVVVLDGALGKARVTKPHPLATCKNDSLVPVVDWMFRFSSECSSESTTWIYDDDFRRVRDIMAIRELERCAPIDDWWSAMLSGASDKALFEIYHYVPSSDDWGHGPSTFPLDFNIWTESSWIEEVRRVREDPELDYHEPKSEEEPEDDSYFTAVIYVMFVSVFISWGVLAF
jgi:hypothetical protein